MEYRIKKSKIVRYLISIPFILAPLVFIILLDIFIELYHQVGFRLYGIALLKRSHYIKLDRYKLPYLSIPEKIFCLYCEYANGFAHYFSEIAGRTEKYWCGIKHKESPNFKEPKHHVEFVKYGDKDEFERKYK